MRRGEHMHAGDHSSGAPTSLSRLPPRPRSAAAAPRPTRSRSRRVGSRARGEIRPTRRPPGRGARRTRPLRRRVPHLWGKERGRSGAVVSTCMQGELGRCGGACRTDLLRRHLVELRDAEQHRITCGEGREGGAVVSTCMQGIIATSTYHAGRPRLSRTVTSIASCRGGGWSHR